MQPSVRVHTAVANRSVVRVAADAWVWGTPKATATASMTPTRVLIKIVFTGISFVVIARRSYQLPALAHSWPRRLLARSVAACRPLPAVAIVEWALVADAMRPDQLRSIRHLRHGWSQTASWASGRG